MNWALKTLGKPILSSMQEHRYPVSYRNQCVDEDTTASTLNQPFPASCSFLPDYRQYKDITKLFSRYFPKQYLLHRCPAAALHLQPIRKTDIENEVLIFHLLLQTEVFQELSNKQWNSKGCLAEFNTQPFVRQPTIWGWQSLRRVGFPLISADTSLSGLVRNTGIAVLASLHACGQPGWACDNQFCKNKILQMEYPLVLALEDIYG